MNWLLLKNSLLAGTGATLLALSWGFVAAVWLAGLSARWRNLFLALAIIALALPPFLVTNCWLDLLGAAGIWRAWLPFNIMSLGGAVWILGLLLWPITLLAVFSAWRRLEPVQLEADPAVTGWALLRLLLFPLARSALAQAGMLTLILALGNFAVPSILQIKVLPAEMWIRFTTAFDTLGVLRMGWPLVLGPLLLLLWFAKRTIPWPHLEPPVTARIFRRQLGTAWHCGAGAGALLLCALSVGLPLWQLASARRTWTELPGAVAAGQDAIWNSMEFAALAATVVVVLGLLATVTRIFNSFNFFNPFNLLPSLLWLPLLLPGVLLGIGLITVFNRPWTVAFYQSTSIVILAFTIRYLGLGWNTVAHAAQTVDRDLIDVARLEGATRWQMLRHAQWPQIKPQVAAAWYVVFLLCLWDVESMILVYPPGGETLALRVFNLLHYGHNAQVNALCLALLVLALIPLCLWKTVAVVSRFRSRASRGMTRPGPGSRVFRRSSAVPFFVVASLPFLLCSCSRSSSGSDTLQSQIFGRVEIIGTRGVGIGQLNKPRSVAVDLQDNLYAVDMTGRVQKFSPNGQFMLFWQMPQTDLGKPKGMGRDREGNIIVVEPHYQRVNFFSTAGQLLAQWGEKGTNAGQLIMPRSVAVNSRGEIFVSEYGQVERVQMFTMEPLVGHDVVKHARFISSLGHAGTGPGEFNRAEGLCVDAQDRLYVADSCNHRIQIFSGDGKFLRMYGRPGKGKGELSYPYDICVDAAGRQYVCEFGNSRIQVFDAHDQPLEIIGGPGAEPGQFANPWSLALDSAGNLYVADSQNHRVQKLLRRAVITKLITGN